MDWWALGIGLGFLLIWFLCGCRWGGWGGRGLKG